MSTEKPFTKAMMDEQGKQKQARNGHESPV